MLVGQLMGHDSPTTTQGYVAWNPAEGAAVVATIASPGVDEVAQRRALRLA